MKSAATARRESRRAARMAASGALAMAAVCSAGCGSGGGSPSAGPDSAATASTATVHSDPSGNSFRITNDGYGMENPTFLSATRSGNGLILRAAVASSMSDPDYKTVSRIDIPESSALPGRGSYLLGAGSTGAPSFPGTLYFFNGHQSTLLQTTGGTITFDSYGANPGDTISGSFRAVVIDGSDSAVPRPSYLVSGTFAFVSGSSGPILPAPAPLPVTAPSLYLENCASCHSLGAFDSSPGSGPDLSLKGGRVGPQFPGGSVAHQGIQLTAVDILGLKILLNVN
jgi:hypothetical protein